MSAKGSYFAIDAECSTKFPPIHVSPPNNLLQCTGMLQAPPCHTVHKIACRRLHTHQCPKGETLQCIRFVPQTHVTTHVCLSCHAVILCMSPEDQWHYPPRPSTQQAAPRASWQREYRWKGQAFFLVHHPLPGSSLVPADKTGICCEYVATCLIFHS